MSAQIAANPIDSGNVVVIRREPATFSGEAPGNKGRVLTTSTVMRETMSNGVVRYACADCTYTAEAYMSVRGHRRAHGVSGGRRAAAAGSPASFDAALAAARAALDAAQKAHENAATDAGAVATWKRRALAAERKLAALRKALS